MSSVLNNFIPLEIVTNKSAVHTVVYFSDLKIAANNLSLCLGQEDVFKFNAVGTTMKAHGGTYVWLVGHGEEDKTAILKVGGGEIADIVDIAKMFEGSGATYLIDTCCSPRARLAAIQASTLTINYFCIENPAGITTQLSLQQDKATWLSTLDVWWGANKLKKAHPKSPIAQSTGSGP